MATTKKETTETTAVQKDPKLMTEEEAKKYWNEKVTIRLPLNPGNPDDQTVFVSVNNYTAQIMRGKDVEVPRNVAEVLRQSEEAELEAFLKRQKMSAAYEEESKKYR